MPLSIVIVLFVYGRNTRWIIKYSRQPMRVLQNQSHWWQIYHYDNKCGTQILVTTPFQWRHMGMVVSQVTGKSIVFVQSNYTRNMKALQYWFLLRKLQRWLVDSPHRGWYGNNSYSITSRECTFSQFIFNCSVYSKYTFYKMCENIWWQQTTDSMLMKCRWGKFGYYERVSYIRVLAITIQSTTELSAYS